MYYIGTLSLIHFRSQPTPKQTNRHSIHATTFDRADEETHRQKKTKKTVEVKRMNEYIDIDWIWRKTKKQHKIHSIRLFAPFFSWSQLKKPKTRKTTIAVHCSLCFVQYEQFSRQSAICFVYSATPNFYAKRIVGSRSIKTEFFVVFRWFRFGVCFSYFSLFTLVRQTNHIRCFFHIFFTSSLVSSCYFSTRSFFALWSTSSTRSSSSKAVFSLSNTFLL